MDYKSLLPNTWATLDKTGTIVSGYKGQWLVKDGLGKSSLHIFVDEKDKFHLAIELQSGDFSVDDPLVAGLSVGIKNFRIEGELKKIIDLECNSSSNLNEFTEIVKEIASEIFEQNIFPIDAVSKVIRNWKAFWSRQSKPLLSEEEIIGLICELVVVRQLCSINNQNAVNSWRGPLGDRHDFNFTDWNVEVKSTKGKAITINGIDQLLPVSGKKLGLLAFKVSYSTDETALSLQGLIGDIISNSLHNRPDLINRFNELLACTGYSPLYMDEYRALTINIDNANFYIVDSSFPKLTLNELKEPLDDRISKVRYSLSLNGLNGIELSKVVWGQYFY